MGCAGSSGGIVLDWLSRLLGATDRVRKADLLDRALALQPGADGLVFLPYISGERSPTRDARASGNFSGLRLHHGPEHLWRAALEGMFLTARGMRDYLGELYMPISDLRVTGGITSDQRVVGLIAACLGQAVSKPKSSEASALGAAHVGLVAVGAYHDLDEVAATVETVTIDCSKAEAFKYSRLAAVSDRLYAATSGTVVEFDAAP